MAKSAAAKELEAKNKAEVAARKAAKKNSDNPQDWGTWRQLKFSYTETAKYDKNLGWILAACVAGPLLLGILIGVLLTVVAHWGWWNILLMALLGLMLGILLAQYMLGTRAKKAMMKRYEGQAGSAEVALRLLGKDWITTPVVAANKQLDAVHRALGPGGLILIGEGESGRTRAMLAQEAKRHEQVAYGVKVHQIMMGKKDGQVPLDHLTKHIQKLPKTMSKSQIDELSKRLTALDAVRSRMPVPKGPMPTMRGSRQAMRGR